MNATATIPISRRHPCVPGALWLMLFFAVLTPAFAQSAPDVDAARAAVISAVRDRLGPGVTIGLDEFSSRLTVATADALAATPDLSARTGHSVRFALTTGPRGRGLRVGEATAVVRVSGPHLIARRALAAGRVLAPDDLELSEGLIDGAPLRRLAARDEVLGSRMLRAVAAGDSLVDGIVAGVPVVRAGDRVVATVRGAGIEASILAVAEQSGLPDQIIRVVNPDSRRAVRARVVAGGEVEVLSGR